MEKIAVVCQAAGGAELISNWLQNKNAHLFCVLEGPAIEIFKRNLGIIKNYSLEEAISSCDWLLSGSSWNSDLEKKALIYSEKLLKKKIVYLDHWICYAERLSYKSKKIVPDEIWVADDYALKIAKKLFPNIKIRNQGNRYLENSSKEIKKNSRKVSMNTKNVRVLFVAENIREHAFLYHNDEMYWGYSEEEALLYFLENKNHVNKNIVDIKIRPHPSDQINKYAWVKDDYGDIVKSVDSNNLLVEDINNSDLIVGCETMAMVLALYVNKTVLSCIPKKGRHCVLPHEGILHLKDLII